MILLLLGLAAGVALAARLPGLLIALALIPLAAATVALALRFPATGVWVDEERLIVGNVFRTHVLRWSDVSSLTTVTTIYKQGFMSFAVRVRRQDGGLDTVPIPLLGFRAGRRVVEVGREHGVEPDKDLGPWQPR